MITARPTARPSLDESASPQTVRAQLHLRRLVLDGELPPGQRVAELALVQRLGVSRTPVRAALQRLAEEGLLEPLPGGGYAVREFAEADIRDAIELRGTLEGLAARRAAERGVPPAQAAAAAACLDAIDAALRAPQLGEAAFARYVELNREFHALVAALCGSELLHRQVDRATTLPFASPSAFVLARDLGSATREGLLIAQHQHRCVLDAIVQRQGARAEALMREHARLALGNLTETLAAGGPLLGRVPGGRLIRPAA